MSEQPYQSIEELLKKLGENASALKNGHLPASDLNAMLTDARELCDRLVVLRYKAFEDQVKPPVAKNTFSEQPKTSVPKKEEKPKRNPGSFQLDFHSQAQMTAEENIIPRNQVNLIDAIAHEELSADPAPEDAPKLSFQAPVHAAPEVEETPVEEVVEAPVAPAQEAPAQAEKAPEPATEKPANEAKESINDRMSSTAEPESLAKKLSKGRIEDLGKSIGINQKFLFMNDLFEGEHSEYHTAVNKLNGLSSFSDAEAYLTELSDQFNWNWGSEEVKSFVELVERRYQ